MSLSLIAGIANAGVGIIDKLVVDKDKKAEFAFQWNMALLAAVEKLVAVKTVPWVDATVKLMIASIALARPLGAFYLSMKGVDMTVTSNDGIDMVEGGMMSLFPTWMGAREVNKSRQHKLANRKLDKNDVWEDEDF